MPADVDTFNMLRQNVVEQLPIERLLDEFERTLAMYMKVSEYLDILIAESKRRAILENASNK